MKLCADRQRIEIRGTSLPRNSQLKTQPKMANSVIQLKVGNGGRITHFTDDHIAGKLMTMGVLPGSRLQVMRIAPFKGGYYLKVDGMCIVVRNDEASSIMTTADSD